MVELSLLTPPPRLVLTLLVIAVFLTVGKGVTGTVTVRTVERSMQCIRNASVVLTLAKGVNCPLSDGAILFNEVQCHSLMWGIHDQGGAKITPLFVMRITGLGCKFKD